MSTRQHVTLATNWTGDAGSTAPTYELVVTNVSDAPISGFTLCMTAPTRVERNAGFEGAKLVSRRSNFVEVAPPESFTLQPGDRWSFSTTDVSRSLNHWSDGATTAWLQFEKGGTLPIDVIPTTMTGDNAPLRRGTEPLPVPGPGKATAPISVVPWPNQVSVSGAREVLQGLAPKGESGAEGAIESFREITLALFPTESICRSEAEGGIPISLEVDQSLPAEGYRIDFSSNPITVSASGHAGWLYGLITLGQILRGARRHKLTYTFPAAGEIVDQPAHGWRGSHFDVSRQFFTSDEVKRFVDVLAWNKLNRLHWHLSDDEGWRVEIDAYPELTQIGAWRGYGMKIPPLLGSGAAPTGGYYTKSAIRDIVAKAGRLGIEIVPEIDVPGHCFAVLMSLPHLADPDETGEYYFHENFPNACLNPAHEPVYEFIETTFSELLELFPSKTFHVGADEVPEGAWEGSPMARAMNEKIGGSGPAELQAAFLKRVQQFLTSKGRITGAWEEAAMGGGIDKANSYLVGWKSIEINKELAQDGYDIVIAPGQHYYLDMANGVGFSEPGASWAGWSGPEETYMFQPGEGWNEEQRAHLMGVQACIWTEHMMDRTLFDRLVFPRLSAIAETGWTAHANKSWQRFSGMAALMPNLYGHWADPVV
ncbi:beta-N-acetylhexosaminidase [Devosia pacifica]|uniref:beta-N-acetylhexosaminidase n=1 Tax=Devosia pacifica TaxID=1335967 RepID=A0A918S5L0_9HYPH|nr:beta-N-acetylhexosaminidase [Devosia pacifica]GHA24337.1 beta-N-acetylhexosaminidase [Devosia pacifica]